MFLIMFLFGLKKQLNPHKPIKSIPLRNGGIHFPWSYPHAAFHVYSDMEQHQMSFFEDLIFTSEVETWSKGY